LFITTENTTGPASGQRYSGHQRSNTSSLSYTGAVALDYVESLSALGMRAFVINQLNHPSKIELTKNAPEPKVVPDQVLVDVYSAGLNFFDVILRVLV